MKPKLRAKGDSYRPTVKVLKEQKGVPTKVSINGHEYILTYDRININKKNEIEQALEKVKEFIAQRQYNYSVEQLVENYLKYYKGGFFVSRSLGDCIEHVGEELELLSRRKREWKWK